MLAVSRECAAQLTEGRDGRLEHEAVIAGRKSFLYRKKLTYRCALRIDEAAREVRFFEILKESGFGLGGAAEGCGPGFSVKKEVYGVSGKEREGTIDAQASLFGKHYNFHFDFGAVRNALKAAAEQEGYAFKVCLLEKSL